MKHNNMIVMLYLAGAMVFTACSSEDNTSRKDNEKTTVTLDNGTFTFSEEEFSTDQAAGQTRTKTETLPQTKTVSLGDDIEAEVGVEADAPQQNTRAPQPISEGHYTIRAYDHTTHDLKGTLSGTIAGGKFVRDAGTRMWLEPGTYDFVCHNDAVDLVTNPWWGQILSVKTESANPMIGTATAVVSGRDYVVHFNMQHKAMRVRLKITTEPKLADKIDAELQGNVYGTVYNKEDLFRFYDGVRDSRSDVQLDVHPTYVFNDIPCTETATGAEYLSPYKYILPTPYIDLKTYKINFKTGKIFGRALAGKELLLSSVALPAGYAEGYNSSITINVKVKILPHYLFQDGSVDVLPKKGSRTPIGLVVTEKTATTQGLAVALNSTANVIWEDDGTFNHTGNSYQNNTVCYPNPSAGTADMNGYNWTWDPASSLDGKTRANEQTKYPAFYVAGHYNPGVTVTGANVGRWFLPSFGQLVALIRLTDPDYTIPASMPWFSSGVPLSNGNAIHQLNNCLKQAGGVGLGTLFFTSSSTQNDGSTNFRNYQPTAVIFREGTGNGNDAVQLFVIWKKMSNGGVLPFVHF